MGNLTFKDRPWHQRVQRLGDEAETIFEQWAARNNIGFHRSGINRPPFNVGKLPTMVSYTPDYLTDGGYIEVQGSGKGRQVKIKNDKLDALASWDLIFKTQMFLWDNVTRQVTLVPLSWFAYNLPNEVGVHPEGKLYKVWNADRIPGWVPHESN